MSLIIVTVCLAAIIALYFYNNPLRHSSLFLLRRFINWFPLGMTYAFLYMGRYNLTVSQTALGGLMSKQDFGLIFGIGTWTYALSFLVNGPLRSSAVVAAARRSIRYRVINAIRTDISS